MQKRLQARQSIDSSIVLVEHTTSIKLARTSLRVLAHGQQVGVAVHRGGRGVDEASDALGLGELEQELRAQDVVVRLDREVAARGAPDAGLRHERYRSSGRRPLCLATRASMRGPISSRS